MEKEELLIKRHEEDIKKWDVEIADIEKKIGLAGGQEKKDYESKIKELSGKIADAKEEIRKLRKKVEEFPGIEKNKEGNEKLPPIYPPRSTGGS